MEIEFDVKQERPASQPHQLLTASPQSGGKAESLSLGSKAVFKNNGASGEGTPCPLICPGLRQGRKWCDSVA